MSAVVGVLNESLTESIRGFYKLRKAYGTLAGLMEMENRYMKAKGVSSLSNSRKPSVESMRSVKSTGSGQGISNDPYTGKALDLPHTAIHPSALRNATTLQDDTNEDSDNSDEFYDADEPKNGGRITKTYTGKLETSLDTSPTTQKLASLSLDRHNSFESGDSPSPSLPNIGIVSNSSMLDLLSDASESALFVNPVDAFIHSGANLCFGLLSLLISIIPPAFSKLLYIIGFRGDRE